MQGAIPKQMKAAAIDKFGGPEVLHTETLPVPKPKAGQVLIRLDSAGIGVWDPYVRSGELELGKRDFPQVIGNDGAGEVVAVGDRVKRHRVGDRVYAFGMEGGFYAEYVAIDENLVAPIPQGLSPDEAGALGADGITALIGLDDQLKLQRGESLMVYGASGGIGHLALQLAKRMGARVLAVASGADGLELVRRLGADDAVDGKRDDVPQAVRQFAPKGLDAALVLVHGEGLEAALTLINKGGRFAYPHGVEPEPRAPSGVKSLPYDGTPSPDAFERLNRLIAAGPFHIEVGGVYQLENAAQAHRELERHHLGKLAFRIHA
ncbi:MAG TPA: NADP-dependent oxidoreductase [Anaeromyxobacteraceae bacterium]|nr:NADP-dependent oxidoreductase [Anaeromyxobacteraceae bacterium]